MNRITFLSFLIISIFSMTTVFGQIDVNLVDLDTQETVPFSEIYDKYGLNKELPTMIITWSGVWCYPCIELIERYNVCDTSLVNIITVNVDDEDDRSSVLAKGHHKNWKNTKNFHANIGGETNGFDNVFNVSSAPLILYFLDGKMLDATVSYSIYPYTLVQLSIVNDINFIANSWSDLNSLAWNYYQNETDSEQLNKALSWAKRSIELDKNYHNTDTYAALLFKTGEYTQALKIAKEAIDIAKENENDYESTSELINRIIEKL
ncbi:hypothetical protein [Robertkochia solimangrovi]|uniref:hypothetical protein n=1 Tax=Robertkochia solimangrovi TaxID=2213046 RepID=UPI00117E68CE|nr:hypothetical protein [Robertkochia solimangrovi]TRZ43159.1 hypothetical protein DMZ48_10730 [Robertkochia solimangrovi]